MHTIRRSAASVWPLATEFGRRLIRATLLAMSIISFSVAAKVPVGVEAPDFTLDALSGGKVRLQDLRGRVVMINFWATWCAPCRLEMPHLVRLQEKYRSAGFILLGVNIDDDRKVGAATATM